jgi:hypothetical protein
MAQKYFQTHTDIDPSLVAFPKKEKTQKGKEKSKGNKTKRRKKEREDVLSRHLLRYTPLWPKSHTDIDSSLLSFTKRKKTERKKPKEEKENEKFDLNR